LPGIAARNYHPRRHHHATVGVYPRACGLRFPQGWRACAGKRLSISDLARNFEANGATSFRSFIDHLEGRWRGDAAEAPLLEQDADGVKLMTVHRAKGLEFPVVIPATSLRILPAWMAAGVCRHQTEALRSRILSFAPWELLANREKETGWIARRPIAWPTLLPRAHAICSWCRRGDSHSRILVDPLHDALYPTQDRWRIPVKPKDARGFGIAPCWIVRWILEWTKSR